MPYSVDFDKAPKSLLLELINVTNELDLTLEQLEFTNYLQSTKEGYNTQVDVWWRTTADMVGKVTVHYNRIELDILFSITGLTVKELNIDVDSGRPVINDRVYAEIARRYPVTFTSEDFELVDDGNNILLKARSNNAAYTSQFPVLLERSLRSRVANPVLDGWFLFDPTDIIMFVENQSLDAIRIPSRINPDKISAEIVTYGVDASTFQGNLALNANGGFIYHDALLANLAVYGVPAFSNPIPSAKAILYPVAAYPDAIQTYTHVVVIETVVSETMAGRVMLHFTVGGS